MVRVLFYVGIVRLGVSRAGPIRGTAPLFSVAIAFFLFHERPALIVYLGGVLTVAGTWLVSYKREGEAEVARHRSFISVGRGDAGVGVAEYS